MGTKRVATGILGVAAVLAGCGGGGPSSTNGDGSGKLNQRPSPAMPLFDESVVHEVSLEMSPEDWQSILQDTRGDEFRHAKLTYDGVVVDDVGVRPSGESSRFPGNPKMSMRIKFNAFDGRGEFGGYEDISVKGEFDDGSMMRERLALFAFAALMPAAKAAHTRLTVNGDPRGLYTLRETWDAASVAQHFPEPLGPLYRVRPPLGVDPYAYLGSDPASYVPSPWERHIEKAVRGDDVVPAFLQALTTAPGSLEAVTDVNNLIEYIVVSTLVMTTDGLVGSSGASDHYQYFDPQSGKFFVLPWDPDNTFGSQDEKPEKLIYSKLGRNALTLVVRDRDDLRHLYQMKLAEGMATLPAAMLQAKADAIYAQIKDAAYADPLKMWDNGTFDWNLMAIKDFIAARYANVMMQLAE